MLQIHIFSGSDVILLRQITKQQTDIPAEKQINESVGESRQVPASSASMAVTYSTTQDPSLYDRWCTSHYLLCHLHLIYWQYILCVCGVDEYVFWYTQAS